MRLEMPIRDIMTTTLVTVTPDASIDTIQRIFTENTFHHLPVVEAGSRLVGIISREDFRVFYKQLAADTSGPTWSRMQREHRPVKDIMTATPLCLDPDDTIGLAADIFLANQFHALPVVEDDLLIGILTTHDILAYSVSSSKVDEESISEESLS